MEREECVKRIDPEQRVNDGRMKKRKKLMMKHNRNFFRLRLRHPASVEKRREKSRWLGFMTEKSLASKRHIQPAFFHSSQRAPVLERKGYSSMPSSSFSVCCASVALQSRI